MRKNLKLSVFILLPNRLLELLSFTYIFIYFLISHWPNKIKLCKICRETSINNQFSGNLGKLKVDIYITASPKYPQWEIDID